MSELNVEMIDVNEITIQNYSFDIDSYISFEVVPDDKLIRLADEIRELNGCHDKAMDSFNDVWYDFYLVLDAEEERVLLYFVCNNGELDDFQNYNIELEDIEKKKLAWKAFREFLKELGSGGQE